MEAELKYNNGKGSYDQIVKEYKIKPSSLQEIASKYAPLGKDRLKDMRSGGISFGQRESSGSLQEVQNKIKNSTKGLDKAV